MRWFALLLPFVFGLPLLASAGPRVNNGGGVWVCRTAPKGEIVWVKAHDLFLMERYARLAPRWQAQSAEEIYRTLLNEISSPASPLSRLIDLHPLDLLGAMRVRDVDISLTGDGNISSRPLKKTCPEGRVGFEQVADFLYDDALFIDAKIWGHHQTPEVDKAAILLHEHVYYLLRKYFGDESSQRTQHIVAALFSDQPPPRIRHYIASLLKSSGYEKQKDTVVLFPVRLQCQASVYRITGTAYDRHYRRIDSRTYADFPEGTRISQEMAGALFEVETSPEDGRPTSLRITQLGEQVRTEVSGAPLEAAFQQVRHVVASLENTRSNQQAFLECWTD